MRDAANRFSAQVVVAWTLAVYVMLFGVGCDRSGSGRTASGGESADRPAHSTTELARSGGSAAAARENPVLAPVRLDPRNAAAVVDRARLDRLVDRNLAPGVSLPESLIGDRIAAWRGLPVGARIARWARLFASRTDNAYCFGPKPGGYVAESLLVQDHRFDCVLLFYRSTELARATSPRDAILCALGTRFRGGDPQRVVNGTGGVDYDDPSHLDYSEDFAETGLWGRDVTEEVGTAMPDSVGTSRYPAGTRSFIPKDRIRLDRLRDGDLLFFVLDERHAGARKLREEYGLLIGHQGIVHVSNGEVHVVHAAASDLKGVYSGNRVVEVPLRAYLDRLDRFKGIMVSRIDDVPTESVPR